MKTSDKLKILAMETCFNSKLSTKTKKKHLEYIKESDPYICIGYILDGKFYNLNEDGKRELKKRFLKEQGTNLTMRRKSVHSAIGATGSILSGGTGYIGYRLLKGLFSKCARACGMFGLNTTKRQYCLISCRVKVKQQEINELQKMIPKCGNDMKCKQRFIDKINKVKDSLPSLIQKQQKAKQFMLSHGKDTSKADTVQPGQFKPI
jgi:hypothetical protein